MRAVVKVVSVACMAFLLAACGGDDGGSPGTQPQTNPPPVSGANAAPTIQGQPGTSVVTDQSYSFQARATDPDNDALTFSATNLPAWLSLNANTGRLTGTPSAADVGTYQDITISVSDGRATATLAAFSISVTAVGSGSATLSWVAPTQNTDGSSLTDLTGFTIRYGRSADDLAQAVQITNPSVSTYVVENLSGGAWYFAVTAVNGAGAESSLSNVASKTIS